MIRTTRLELDPPSRRSASVVLGLTGLWLLVGCSPSGSSPSGDTVRLLNVSYDPTREFYQEFNQAFAADWLERHGQRVVVDQSHGGAGKQARAVMDGLEADVVTLAIGYDIDVMAERTGLLPVEWQSRLPNNSAPYTSTIVFLVRKGNPKNIRDWGDLVQGDVSVITTNPKTSGGARWNYLSAWVFALNRALGDISHLSSASPEQVAAAEQQAERFVQELYRRVPVLDSGARGATNTFLQRGLGDVLLTWENEAYMALQESAQANAEIVVPSISLLTEPPVAVVDRFATKHGTQEVARGYLEFLYSPLGQQLAAKYFFRPSDVSSLSADQVTQFSALRLVRINDVFGDWRTAQSRHFDDGGLFDRIYEPGKGSP